MKSSNGLIVSILVVAGLALAFWVLLLSPKRSEASELSAEAGQLQVALSEAQSKAAEATAARQAFPSDYRQLVVLGQAVPADDETSSLLVELSTIAKATKVTFDSIQLESAGSASSAPASVPPPAPSSSQLLLRRRAGLFDHPAERGRRLAASARRFDRPGRPRRDAVRPHLQRQLLPDRQLHQGHRLPGPYQRQFDRSASTAGW